MTNDATACVVCGSTNTVHLAGNNYGCHNCGEEFHPGVPAKRYRLLSDEIGKLKTEVVELPIASVILTKRQWAALAFLNEIASSAEISNRTGYTRLGPMIHRLSAKALITAGYAMTNNVKCKITNAGRTALASAQHNEAAR